MRKNKCVKVKIAKTAGFCFGVRRAIKLAEKTACSKNKVYTMGPLIHNPQEVKRLARNGIKPIKNPWRIRKDTLILRTHGIPLSLKEKLEHQKFDLVDATCPFVKRTQDIVKKLTEQSYQVIIIGDKTHPEVMALVSYGKNKCHVVESKADLKKMKLSNKTGVVSQTTQTRKNFQEIISDLKQKRPDVRVYNTICRATVDRQSEALYLAKSMDLMIVVGGKNSGNTKRLYEICRSYTLAYHIEMATEIKPAWLKRIRSVGLTAGASTPDWIIREVESKIKYMKKEKEKWKKQMT